MSRLGSTEQLSVDPGSDLAMLMLLCLLLGALLAQRCKVLVLVPAIALIAVLAAALGARAGDTFLSILAWTAVDIAALQVGYLAGVGGYHLSSALQSDRHRGSSVSGPLTPRHTAN
jgi:hypothetical protein